MDILTALAQQKTHVTTDRVMCENGMLSISDAVFGVALYKAGYSPSEIQYLILNNPLDKREQFLKQIGQEL